MKTPTISLVAVAVLGLAACTTDDTIRTSGVTEGAGNAIAANTVMQMVDPWQAGVDDTELAVPADRGAASPAAAAAEASEASAPATRD